MKEIIIDDRELLLGIIGLIVTIFCALFTLVPIVYQVNRSKKITLELKLREEKGAIYSKVYSFIFDLLKEILDNKEYDKTLYKERYMELKQLLLFNASDKVLNHFVKLNFDTQKKDSVITLQNYLTLLLLIRKELGHKNKRIDEKSILRLLVANEKDYMSLCYQLGYKKKGRFRVSLSGKT